MFEKRDIVKFKECYTNKNCKGYKSIPYLVTYVNKKNGKVWVTPLERQQYFFWRLTPNVLIKVGHYE